MCQRHDAIVVRAAVLPAHLAPSRWPDLAAYREGVAGDGRLILLDLERCSVGPPEWDLVSTAVKYVTFGQVARAEYQRFCDTNGQDVTSWDGFPVLRDIRELRVTCYAAQQAAEHPQLASEASLRVACVQGLRGPRPRPWTPV